MNKKDVKVKVATLAIIYDSLKPYIVKANSLLAGHYEKQYIFSDSDFIILLESMVTSSVLESFLGDLLEQSRESKVESLFLKPEEISTISMLAKTVASFSQRPIGQTSFVEH